MGVWGPAIQGMYASMYAWYQTKTDEHKTNQTRHKGIKNRGTYSLGFPHDMDSCLGVYDIRGTSLGSFF